MPDQCSNFSNSYCSDFCSKTKVINLLFELGNLEYFLQFFLNIVLQYFADFHCQIIDKSLFLKVQLIQYSTAFKQNKE